MSTSEVLKQWRVPGFGKHPEIGAVVEASLREAGLAPTIMVIPHGPEQPDTACIPD